MSNLGDVYLVSKRRNKGSEASKLAATLADAIAQLDEIRGIVNESGGGFQDVDFLEAKADGTPATNLAYVNAYQMNVFINIVVPGLVAALATHLEGNPAAATYQQILRQVRP